MDDAMGEAELEAFLHEPNVGVLATVDAQGRPRQAPVWFRWEDGAAYLFTAPDTVKWRNLQRDPRASLCVDRREPPYAAALVEGTVEPADRPLHELVLAMALAYYGEERGRAFAEAYRAGVGAVAFKLVPRRITSWSYDSY